MVTENGTINNDGQSSWYDANGTSLFINNGDNTFTRQFIASNRNFYATSLFGDFNCDGYPDILLNGWHDDITGADGVKIGGGWELVIMTNEGKGTSITRTATWISCSAAQPTATASTTATAATARWLSFSAMNQTAPM